MPETLATLREAAAGCRACPLWQIGTQTVFGEGPQDAELMLVGEQPGDREDREGRPFVGPAGRLLDEALEEAGIDRTRVYVTNAVKHFKWQAARQAQDPCEAELVGGRRLPPVAGRASWRSSGPTSSSASARPPRRRCSAAASA